MLCVYNIFSFGFLLIGLELDVSIGQWTNLYSC